MPLRNRPEPQVQAAVPGNYVLVGEFGRAHGLKGEVRLKAYTADPLAIADYNPLLRQTGRPCVLTRVRRAAGDRPDMLVAHVDGVTTREAAEALNRIRLYVERARLAQDVGEDEFLLADLVGLAAVDEEGQVLGTVVAVPNYGGGDLLDIARAGHAETVLVPFTKAFVPLVDLAGRRVVLAASDLFA